MKSLRLPSAFALIASLLIAQPAHAKRPKITPTLQGALHLLVSGADIGDIEMANPEFGATATVQDYLSGGAQKIYNFLHFPNLRPRFSGPNAVDRPSGASQLEGVFDLLVQNYGASVAQELRSQLMALTTQDLREVVSAAVNAHKTKGVIPRAQPPHRNGIQVSGQRADTAGLNHGIVLQLWEKVELSPQTIAATQPTPAETVEMLRISYRRAVYHHARAVDRYAAADQAFMHRSSAEIALASFYEIFATITAGTLEMSFAKSMLAKEMRGALENALAYDVEAREKEEIGLLAQGQELRRLAQDERNRGQTLRVYLGALLERDSVSTRIAPQVPAQGAEPGLLEVDSDRLSSRVYDPSMSWCHALLVPVRF